MLYNCRLVFEKENFHASHTDYAVLKRDLFQTKSFPKLPCWFLVITFNQKKLCSFWNKMDAVFS